MTSDRSTSWANAAVTVAASTPHTAAASAASNDPANTDRSAKVRWRSLVEQPERPRHRRAQRAVPAGGAVAGRQQREAVVEAGRHLGHVVGVQPGGGQLDGQRQAVEAAHDLGDDSRARRRSGSKPGATARARSTNSSHGRRAPRRRPAASAPCRPARPAPAAAPGWSPPAARSGSGRADARPARRPDRGRARSCRAAGPARLSPSTSATRSASGTPGRPSIPRAAATTSSARRPSRRGQLAQHDRPIGPAAEAAGARPRPSSRVLPTPPGPTSVTSRSASARPVTSAASTSRPTSEVAGTGSRVAGAGSVERRRRRRGGTGGPLASWAGWAGEQGCMLRRQRRRRLDAQLVGEQPPEVVVGPQRLGRATGRRQRRHQQRARPLTERFGFGEGGQLGHQAVGRPPGQPPLGPGLLRPEPQLVEARRLGPALVDVVELGVRRPLPPLEQRVELRHAPVLAGPAPPPAPPTAGRRRGPPAAGSSR